MRFILYFITFLMIYDAPLSVIIFDLVDNLKYNELGEADYNLSLLEVDLFYKIKGNDFFCEQWAWLQYECDYTMAYIYCWTLIKYKSLWDNGFNRDDFIYYWIDYPEFTSVITIYDDDPSLHHYGYCGKLSYYTFSSDVNFWYLDYPNMVPLYKQRYLFSYHSYFRTIVGDANLANRVYLMGIFEFRDNRINISVDYNFLRQTQFIPYFTTEMILNAVMEVRCLPNWYGQTCWYNCETDSRQTCNCPRSQRATSRPCNVTCVDKYFEMGGIVVIADFIYYITVCYLIDYCRNAGKDCKKICLQLGNDTGLCVDIYLLLNSQFQPNNITATVLFFKEIVNVEVYHDNNTHPYIYINSTVKFSTLNVPIFNKGAVDQIKPGPQLSFQILGVDYIDYNFSLYYEFKLYAWQRTFDRFHDVRIYKIPDEVTIHERSGSAIVERVIIAGDILFCNSTGLPEYRTVILLSLIEFNVNLYPNNIAFVPETIPPIFANVRCFVTLIVKDREFRSLKKKIKVYAKLLKDFFFIPLDNLLLNTELLICTVFTYLKYNMSVYQISGIHEVYILGNTINISNALGGVYSFGCFLQLHTLARSTFKEVSIQMKPTRLCYFLFAHTFGSIIQCNHNGFLRDEYDISLELFRKSNSEAIVIGEKYVRIPYYLKFNELLAHCVVKQPDDVKLKLELYKNVTLETKSIGVYAESESERYCAIFDIYVGLYSIQKRTPSSIYLFHFLYYFEEKGMRSGEVVFICYLITMLSTTIYCYFSVQSNHDENSWKETINNYVHFSRARELRAKLTQETNKYVDTKELYVATNMDGYSKFLKMGTLMTTFTTTTNDKADLNFI